MGGRGGGGRVRLWRCWLQRLKCTATEAADAVRGMPAREWVEWVGVESDPA